MSDKLTRITEQSRALPGSEWVIFEACRILDSDLDAISQKERAPYLEKLFPWATDWAIGEGLAEWEVFHGRSAGLGVQPAGK